MSKCYDNPDYDDSESDIQNTWNQHPKVEQERKKNFYCGDEVDYDDKCLEQCDGCVDATGVDYGYLPEEETKCYCGHTTTCDCGPEDSKQNIIDMMKGDEELGLYDEIQPEQIWNEEKKKGIKQLIQDHKKETLEEAAEREYSTIHEQYQYDAFIEGAKWQKGQYTIEEQHIERSIGELEKEYIKGFNQGSYWQQERSYSDEEVLKILNEFCDNFYENSIREDIIIKWFEQFKKK